MKRKRKRRKNARGRKKSVVRRTNPKRKRRSYRRKRKSNPMKAKRMSNVRRKRRSTRRKRKMNPMRSSYTKRYRRRSKRARRRNPTDMPTGTQGLTGVFQPILAGAAGFMFPGLVTWILGTNGRKSIADMFGGQGTQVEKDIRAQAAVSVMSFIGAYFLTEQQRTLAKFRTPLLIGTGVRAARDLSDAVLERKPGSFGANIRRLMSLPVAAQNLSFVGYERAGVSGYETWAPALAGYEEWTPALAGYENWTPALAGMGPAIGYEVSGMGPAIGYEVGNMPAVGYEVSGANPYSRSAYGSNPYRR